MKKLTLFKGKAIACLILMCLLLAQSCKKDLLQPNKNDLHNGVSIAEAKKYFNANIKRTVKPAMLMATGKLEKEITLADFLANKEPLWEKAYEKMLSTGPGVKIPIDFGKAYAVINPDKNEVVPLNSLNYLFMYKDSLQAIHTEWVILQPDKEWLYGDRSTYTGDIIVKDWEGNTIKNFYYRRIGTLNTSSNIKGKLLSSAGKIQDNEGGDEISQFSSGGIYCIKIPTGRCPKIPPRCDQIYCDGCLELCAKQFCSWIPEGCTTPECEVPPVPGAGGGGGGGPVNPSKPGGGGAYPPDDCGGGRQLPKPPVTNPDNSSIPLPPCVPKPVRLKSSTIENFMGITDPDKQNFLLTHNDIYEVLENYLVTNGDTPENKEFVNWAIGYLKENSGIIVEDFKSEYLDYTLNPSNTNDVAIINNGVEINDAPTVIPNSPKPIIGSTTNRNNTEDMTYGTNHDASGVNPQMLTKSDATLFISMKDLISVGTTRDGELRQVALDFIDIFRNNSSINTIASNPILNKKVEVSAVFANFVRAFGAELQTRLKQTGGDINGILIDMRQIRPIFNGNYNMVAGLTILLNDTEQSTIRLESYDKLPNGEFIAVIEVTIMDHFGLDKHDVLSKQHIHDGFAAWWILQHNRGFVPFQTKVISRKTINGYWK